MGDYKPEFVHFCEYSLKKVYELSEEEKEDGSLFHARKGYEKFWEKVNELRRNNKKCRCDCDEEWLFGCTKCFLDKDEKSVQTKWVWSEPRNSWERWLCYSLKLYRDSIKFKSKEGVTGAMVMAQTRGNVWELFRFYFFNKQDGRCAMCGEEKNIADCELHHINAKINGGREEEDNLQMLCKLCHRVKIAELYYPS